MGLAMEHEEEFTGKDQEGFCGAEVLERERAVQKCLSQSSSGLGGLFVFFYIICK